jgi:DNA-binding MarR family transcriptional regulator
VPEKPEYSATRIPAAALWEAAMDAFFVEFRAELEQTPFGDVRPTHGCVFRFVPAGQGMRLTRLAELANMTKQSVGEIVDDLAAKDYLERVPDPVDKRAKLIVLTPRGIEAQERGFALIAQTERRWAERYGEKRWAAMRSLFEEIVVAEAPDLVPELARGPASEPVPA